MRPTRGFLLAGALALLPGSTLAGQSPREIVERALAQQDARTANVENYTLVQEFNGQEMLQYHEAREVGGHRMFVVTRTLVGGRSVGGAQDEGADPFYMYERWIQNAEVAGSERVDGHDTWILRTDNLEAMAGPSMSDADLREGEVRLYIDKDDYVVRRMVFEGTADVEGQARDMSMTANLLDYRNVDGVLHPVRMEATVSGAMSGAESAEMKEALAEMEKRLAELPENVRKQVEGQMRAQMEAMGGMASGEGMKMTVTTKEVRVNQGPPGD